MADGVGVVDGTAVISAFVGEELRALNRQRTGPGIVGVGNRAPSWARLERKVDRETSSDPLPKWSALSMAPPSSSAELAEKLDDATTRLPPSPLSIAPPFVERSEVKTALDTKALPWLLIAPPCAAPSERNVLAETNSVPVPLASALSMAPPHEAWSS